MVKVPLYLPSICGGKFLKQVLLSRDSATGIMDSAPWVDLLSASDKLHKQAEVMVMESTPVSRATRSRRDKGPKLKENGNLKAALEHCQVVSKGQLEEAGHLYQEACQKLDCQGEIISQLMGDNSRLLSQIGSVSSRGDRTCRATEESSDEDRNMEGAVAHVHSLCGEVKCLSAHLQSSSPDTSSLLLDLERLTSRNAELCSALAATQHSRSVLERQVISLKRTLHSERSQLTNSDSTLTQSLLLEENKRILLENEKLKIDLDQACQHKNEELESYKNDIDNLRQSQINEIDLRCREVDSLKEQLSNQLETLQEDSDLLARQVADLSADKRELLDKVSCLESKFKLMSEQSNNKYSKLLREKETLEVRVTKMSELGEQLKADNATLRSQQRSLEDRLNEQKAAKDRLTKKLQENSSTTAAVIAELESTRASSVIARQQLAKAKEESEQLKEQLHSLSELNTERKLLLEQRASRVQYLEKLLHKQDDHSLLTHTCNGSVSNSLTTVNVQQLRRSLSDSKQVNLQLEVELTQLKTDSAKLSGSYNALMAIKQKFSQDNSRLSSRNRDLHVDNQVLAADKEFLLKKVELLSRECLRLSASEQGVKDELVKVCDSREKDIEEFSLQLHTLQDMNGELQAAAMQVESLHECMFTLQTVVGQEVEELSMQHFLCEEHLQTSLHHMTDVTENVRLCALVNDTRQAQVEECDRSAAALQGELEVLRAKKLVLLSISYYPPLGPSSPPSLLGPPSSLAMDTLSSPASISLVSSATSTTSRSHNLSKEQLKRKLKLLRKKNDFLRVRLGYALSELRLYHQQKLCTDQQLNQLQDGLAQVQRQYRLCANQLDTVEQHI